MLYLSRTYATNKKPKWDVRSWVKCPSPIPLSEWTEKTYCQKNEC